MKGEIKHCPVRGGGVPSLKKSLGAVTSCLYLGPPIAHLQGHLVPSGGITATQ